MKPHVLGTVRVRACEKDMSIAAAAAVVRVLRLSLLFVVS